MPPSNPSRRVVLGTAGALAAAAACTGVAFFHASARASGLATLTWAGVAFQTPIALTVAGADQGLLESAVADAFTAIRAVEDATSVYRPHSDLSRLNREGTLKRPHPHLVALTRYALKLAAETGGSFDPTVQPLWDVWARANAQGTRPSDAQLDAVLRRVDWRHVSVSEAEITFGKPGMAMTLNSINQGYAADIVMRVLARHGVQDAMVDTGEFGARGHHASGRDWRLGVVAPRDPDRLAFVLDPFRRFAATSGDYKTFFSPDFRDHHIFDPRTGRSPPHWSSITVSAPSGLEADGLSTALFVLNASDCRSLLARHPDCGAHFFDKSGREVRLTPVQV